MGVTTRKDADRFAGHGAPGHGAGAALAHLASNADEIADFLSHLNPYLQRDTVRSLVATHGAHHVLQLNQYQAKDDAPTHLCHCGYAHDGIGEAISEQVFVTGVRDVVCVDSEG